MSELEFPENQPALWIKTFPRLKPDGHKYDRGHALIFSGGLEGIGAARLSARAALRAGAGLVTLVCPEAALSAHAARGPDALMVRHADDVAEWQKQLADSRITSILIGPAFGVGQRTCDAVGVVLQARRTAVLDADALTSFSGSPEQLFEYIRRSGPVVLTPHSGEFRRLFGNDIADLPREKGVQLAATLSGATVVLKGAKTLICEPEGRLVESTNGVADLATAGSGDVLAGLVAGLLAQGMPAFEAACAGVWLHGEAGKSVGAGLIADDLPEAILPFLRTLRHQATR